MVRILVTGVRRGIGAALMQAGGAAGHKMIGTTRDGAGGTIALTMDEPDAISGQLAYAPEVDVLINNAGIIGPDRQDPLDMDWAGFAETLTVNTLAPLAVTHAMLPKLRGSDAPKILTISSQMAWMGYRKSNRIAYRASKAAVNKVMQGLATRLEPEGVAVALVDPGWVRTDMGGAEADEDAGEVAAGIIALAERLTLADTSKFFRFTGEERDF